MGRIDETFKNLKEKGEGALLVYLIPGDPSLEKSLDCCLEMEKAGADIIEMGIPWENPYLDGPVIRQAHKRVLNRSVEIEEIMDLIKALRKTSSIPIVLMSYYQAILSYGFTHFISLAKEVSVDGILIPDLPLEKRTYFIQILKESDLSHIFMISSKSSPEEIKRTAQETSGFLYMASHTGLTGIRSFPEGYLSLQIKKVKAVAGEIIPLVVGFGLSKEEDVREVIRAGAQGAVVGSSVVKRIEKGKTLYPYIHNLKDATKIF